jgi:phosphate-selective porin OprO and OprP
MLTLFSFGGGPVRRLLPSAVALVVVLGLRPAQAQEPAAPARPAAPRPNVAGLAAEIEKLRAEIVEARRELSQVPGAVAAIATIEARLAAMQTEAARLAAMRSSESELRRELDLVREQHEALRRQLASVQAELAQAPGPTVVPAGLGHDGRGFYLRSEDDRYELRVGGYVQAGYEGAWRRLTPATSDAATYDERRNLSALALRRARLLVGGHVLLPGLTYAVDLELARPDLEQRFVWGAANQTWPLKEYYLDLEVRPWLAIRAGQFLVPSGRERAITADKLELVERSLVDAAFSLDRDLGLMLHGALLRERLAYQAAVLNGQGPNVAHGSGNFLWAGRVLAMPFGPVPLEEGDLERSLSPRLAVGGSASFIRQRWEVQNGTAVDVAWVDRLQAGGELSLRWRGAALLGEITYRRETPGTGPAVPRLKSTLQSFAAYAQASYFVIRSRLQVAGRFAYAQTPWELGYRVYGALPDSSREATLGATYYHLGHRAKLMLDASYIDEQKVELDPGVMFGRRRSARVRAAGQLQF